MSLYKRRLLYETGEVAPCWTGWTVSRRATSRVASVNVDRRGIAGISETWVKISKVNASRTKHDYEPASDTMETSTKDHG